MGRSTFRPIIAERGGFWVVEEWSQADHDGNRDDGWLEYVAGPFPTLAAAQAEADRRSVCDT